MNSQLNVIVKNLIDAHGIENVQSVLNDIIKSCNKEEDEPILNADNMKFTTYPITYQHIWDNVYKIQMASFWTAEEIDFSNDYDDFLTLNKNEQHFIEMILAFLRQVMVLLILIWVKDLQERSRIQRYYMHINFKL